VSNTLEYGALTLHAGYLAGDVDDPATRPLFDAFRQFGPQGAALADKYQTDKGRAALSTLGASYDPGRWFVMGEWAVDKISGYLGQKTAWFASGGMRLGKFTPYAIYSSSRQRSNSSDPGLNLAGLPPSLAGLAAGLNGGLNRVLMPSTSTTVSLGTRWEWRKNADLKLQFDHVRLDPLSSGGLANLQPGFKTGSQFNVISATVDFVF
jgi:hypothetical protein